MSSERRHLQEGTPFFIEELGNGGALELSELTQAESHSIILALAVLESSKFKDLTSHSKEIAEGLAKALISSTEPINDDKSELIPDENISD
jgi:hypothetical protein